MNDRLKIFIIVMIGCLIATYFIYSNNETRKEKLISQKIKAEEATKNDKIEAFKKKYNASSDWVNKLPKPFNIESRPIYTIDLEDLFINSNNAILIRSSVFDIKKINNKYVVDFQYMLDENFPTYYYIFRLNAEKKDVDFIRDTKQTIDILQNINVKFYVVAKITKMQRILFNDESNSALNQSSRFIMNGKCIAIKNIDEEYKPE
jgi:hypothetical protein